MEHIIHIKDGAIQNKVTMRNAFKDLTSGRYLMKLTKSNHRSLNQNAYYHGVVVPLVKEGLKDVGYNEIKTNEDAHEVLKYLFLKKKIGNQETGEVIELLGSTAKLTTTEFMEFIKDIQQWAVEFLGVQIPDPNEQVQLFNQ